MSGRAPVDGFTLIELVIVITLLGVLAWISYPGLASLGEIRLDAASRRVASDLRYAQNRAIGSRETHGVRFEVGAGRYIVYAGNSGAALINPGDRGKTLTVTFAALTETRGVTIDAAAFGATPAVIYDSYGVPRDSTGTELSALGRVVLAFQTLRDTIEVAPQTGAVTIR